MDDQQSPRARLAWQVRLQPEGPPHRLHEAVTDDVASFILDLNPATRVVGTGNRKMIFDMGDDTVARVYSEYWPDTEDPNHPLHVEVAEGLVPLRRYAVGSTRIEIMPRIVSGAEIVSYHLWARLREHGVRWTDDWCNGGLTLGPDPHLVVVDGGLERMLPFPAARFYQYRQRSQEGFCLLAMVGDPDSSVGYSWHPDDGEWRFDPAVPALFDDNPLVTDFWLRAYEHLDHRPHGWPAASQLPSAEALQALRTAAVSTPRVPPQAAPNTACLS